jgi:two-component system NtrC family sensor kinase
MTPSDPPTVKPRVLILDDEAIVGRAFARTLSREFECIALTSAREALTRLAAGETFDAVVCDFTMPEMSGAEFYDELVSSNATLARRLIFATGSTSAPGFVSLIERTGARHLAKPFSSAELRQAILSIVPA